MAELPHPNAEAQDGAPARHSAATRQRTTPRHPAGHRRGEANPGITAMSTNRRAMGWASSPRKRTTKRAGQVGGRGGRGLGLGVARRRRGMGAAVSRMPARPPPGAGGKLQQPGHTPPPDPFLPGLPSSPHMQHAPANAQQRWARDLPPGQGRQTPNPKPGAAQGSPLRRNPDCSGSHRNSARAGSLPSPSSQAAAPPSVSLPAGPPSPCHPTGDHAGPTGAGGRGGHDRRGGQTSLGLHLRGQRALAGPAREPPAMHPMDPGSIPGGD